jgi:hypothetical protein
MAGMSTPVAERATAIPQTISDHSATIVTAMRFGQR